MARFTTAAEMAYKSGKPRDNMRLTFSILGFVAINVLGSASASPVCEQFGAEGKCTLYRASMIELITNPVKFDGKTIRVIGFLNLEFEGNVLYMHKEDYDHAILGNGVWVDTDTRSLPKKATCSPRRYAILEGTFNARNAGHFGAWSGAIEKITRCDAWR
jgi:hypothetical protein